MSTQHRGLDRGLPPPPNTTLPDPSRPPASRQTEYDPSRLPPPTPQRHAQSYDRSDYRDRSEYRERPEYRERSEYRQQYQPETRTSTSEQLRIEEYRYGQEKERTRQEEIRAATEDARARQEDAKLAQRRQEQEIMTHAIRHQTHPNLLPLIFVGLGSASSGGFETAQQYINAVQQIQNHFGNQLPQFSSPDIRRDMVMKPAGPLQFGALGGAYPGATSGSSTSAPGTGVYPSPAYQTQTPQSSHLRAAAGSSQPAAFNGTGVQAAPPMKAPSATSLPRLSTNEAQVSSGASVPNAAQHMVHAQGQGSDRTSPESSIYFHHWQPPATQATAGKEPNKTSPKHGVSLSQPSENTSSPRKRKATGPHQPAPVPSSAPNAASPTFSTTSSTGKRAKEGRESRELAPAEKQDASRGPSKERRELKTEESRDSKDSRTDSRDTSAPPTQPTSTEMSSKPNT